MSTSFPLDIDTFPTITMGTAMDLLSHSIQHINLNDAISAIQSKIGTNGSDNINTSITYQLDDISALFDQETKVFFLTNEGSQVNIMNPFRLLLSIDGIIQSVYTKEIFWQSMFPQTGFTSNSDGSIEFSEPPSFGSQFEAKLLPGPYTTTKTRTYPFRAVDIALGA